MNQMDQRRETEEGRKGIRNTRSIVSKCNVVLSSPNKRQVCFDEQQAIAPAQFDIDENDLKYLWYSVSHLKYKSMIVRITLSASNDITTIFLHLCSKMN